MLRQARGTFSRHTNTAPMTWVITASTMTTPVTARSGSLMASAMAGTHSATAIGAMHPALAIPGSLRIPGDGCRIATDGGSSSITVAGAGLRAAGTGGIAGRAGNMRLRASMLPFLPRTTGSSTVGREKSIGSLRVPEMVEETLDRLAEEFLIAMVITGTPAEAETQ